MHMHIGLRIVSVGCPLEIMSTVSDP